MPNWTTNLMVISGDKDFVARVRRLVISENGQGLDGEPEPEVDFNILCPKPDILSTICSGSNWIDGKHVTNWVNETIDGETVSRKLNELEQTAIKEYGDWYHWCVENWGTKWNAIGCTILQDDPEIIRVRFDTAWSPPQRWFQLLAERVHPQEGCMTLMYADEDFGNNVGTMCYTPEYSTRGVVYLLLANQSQIAWRQAVKLKGYDPMVEHPEDFEDFEFQPDVVKEVDIPFEPIQKKESTDPNLS